MDGNMTGLELYDKLDSTQVQEIIDSNGVKTPSDFNIELAPANDVDPNALAIPDNAGEIATVPATAEPRVDLEAIQNQVSSFAFTPNATPEVTATEESRYLEMLDIPAPLQEILDRRDRRIQELSTNPPADEASQTHMAAFNHFATQYIKNENEMFVPDTAPVRQLLKDVYRIESEQLLTDMLLEPSAKYPQWTKMMEIIKDTYQLPETNLELLADFLENGGQLARPSYLPEGIDRRYLDAYWYSSDRDGIDADLESAVAVIRDSTATENEKIVARNKLQTLNQKLAKEQRLLDIERADAAKPTQDKIDNHQYAKEQGLVLYKTTVIDFVDNSAKALAERLKEIDGAAAPIVAAGFSQLIINAFDQQDEFAKLAQNQLKQMGVSISFVEAAKTLNLILESCSKIKFLEKIDANKRAVDIEKEALANNLRQLKTFEQTLIGQYMATRTKSNGEVIKDKTLKVPITAKGEIVPNKVPTPTPGAKTLSEAERAWIDDPNTTAEDVTKFMNNLMESQRQA